MLEKLLRLPSDMPFDEVGRVLEMFGFQEVRARGSHHAFSDGESLLVIPKVGGRTVKRTYLVEIAERLGLKTSDEDVVEPTTEADEPDAPDLTKDENP